MSKLKHPAVARLTAVTVIAAVGTVAVYFGAQVAGREAAKGTQAVIVAQSATGCDRNQLQRTYDRVDEVADHGQTDAINALRETRIKGETVPPKLTQTPIIANAYFQILNCAATYSPDNRDGGPVYLQRPDEACFIRLVKTHYFVRQAPTTDPEQLRRIC